MTKAQMRRRFTAPHQRTARPGPLSAQALRESWSTVPATAAPVSHAMDPHAVTREESGPAALIAPAVPRVSISELRTGPLTPTVELPPGSTIAESEPGSTDGAGAQAVGVAAAGAQAPGAAAA